MRRGVCLTLLCALVAAGAAQARPHDDLRIRPGVGIAKVRLGMTEAQVRKAMGKPLARRVVRGAFGRREIELMYGIAAYTVTLRGARTARVVAVGTTLAAERTSQGHGVSTRERDLASAFGAKLLCERLETYVYQGITYVETMKQPYRECTVRTARAETVFRTAVSDAWNRHPDEWRPLARVVEVVVRER